MKNEVKDSDLQKLMLAVITEEEEMIDPKIGAELKRDNLMMLQFGVAKELGKDFEKIRDMTLDELIGWSAYFQVINEEQEKEFEKAKRRR